MSTISVAEKRFGCKINLHRREFHCSDPELMHYWTGFTFQQYQKFKWYFRYRAALVQVANPKRYVEFAEFQYEYVPTEEQTRQRLRNKLTAKKAKLTTWVNKLTAYKNQWNSLFPIENDLSYQLAVAQIDKARKELAEAESAISQLAISR